ncbi:MAG: LruC domain-containing protein [Bacteroidetes bacterium]|nr:LruC domain-containing protein [Bacteroidota bacterium]
MKTITTGIGIILFVGLILTSSTHAQLTLTCESGNKTNETSACWDLETVSYVNDNLAITGSYSVQSNLLTNPLPTACFIKTPWMKMGSGNITFKAKLSAANGTTRGIIFSYIAYEPLNPPYYEATPVIFDSTKWSSINTNQKTISSTIPTSIANSDKVYKIRISFVGTGGDSRIYGDDFVIPGNYWSNSANNCSPLLTIQDTDNDGVEDIQDAFPNNPYRANKYFFPIQNHFSSLAFEDLWPAKGDFDFNDVVVDYNSEVISDVENQVVEIDYQFKVRAIGASFKNGFGFELTNINPNSIRNVTGAIIKPGSIYSIAANGTENGQTSATIIAIGNVYDVLPYPGGNTTGVNTTLGAPYSTPQIINIKVSFIENGVAGSSGPVNISQLGSNTFNPFIIVNQNRGREVHLADHKPTSLANTALFGTLQDDSNPGIGRYYRTKTNLPWAINTYQSFQYPIEKTEITKAYLKLIDWVISNGTQYNDWDSNTAYRVNSYIFNH